MNDKELNEIMQDHSGEIERGIRSADRKAAEWQGGIHPSQPLPEGRWADLDRRMADAERQLEGVLAQIEDQEGSIDSIIKELAQQRDRLQRAITRLSGAPQPTVRLIVPAGVKYEVEKC